MSLIPHSQLSLHEPCRGGNFVFVTPPCLPLPEGDLALAQPPCPHELTVGPQVETKTRLEEGLAVLGSINMPGIKSGVQVRY